MDGPVDTPIPNGAGLEHDLRPQRAPGHAAHPSPTTSSGAACSDFLKKLSPWPRRPACVSPRTLTIRPPPPCAASRASSISRPCISGSSIISPSPSNMLEFCLGTLAEMTEGDLYETVDQYSSQHRIAYVHFRNIAGKAPHYHETFIDDGDVDMLRILWILQQERIRRRRHSRPRAADDLLRAVARGHGAHAGLSARRHHGRRARLRSARVNIEISQTAVHATG